MIIGFLLIVAVSLIISRRVYKISQASKAKMMIQDIFDYREKNIDDKTKEYLDPYNLSLFIKDDKYSNDLKISIEGIKSHGVVKSIYVDAYIRVDDKYLLAESILLDDELNSFFLGPWSKSSYSAIIAYHNSIPYYETTLGKKEMLKESNLDRINMMKKHYYKGESLWYKKLFSQIH